MWRLAVCAPLISPRRTRRSSSRASTSGDVKEDALALIQIPEQIEAAWREFAAANPKDAQPLLRAAEYRRAVLHCFERRLLAVSPGLVGAVERASGGRKRSGGRGARGLHYRAFPFGGGRSRGRRARKHGNRNS